MNNQYRKEICAELIRQCSVLSGRKAYIHELIIAHLQFTGFDNSQILEALVNCNEKVYWRKLCGG